MTSEFLLFELDIHALTRERKLAPFDCGDEVYNDAFLIFHRGASAGAASRILLINLFVISVEVFQTLQLDQCDRKASAN